MPERSPEATDRLHVSTFDLPAGADTLQLDIERVGFVTTVSLRSTHDAEQPLADGSWHVFELVQVEPCMIVAAAEATPDPKPCGPRYWAEDSDGLLRFWPRADRDRQLLIDHTRGS